VERLTVPAWIIRTLYLKALVISKFFLFSCIRKAQAHFRISDFVKPRDKAAWAPMLAPVAGTDRIDLNLLDSALRNPGDISIPLTRIQAATRTPSLSAAVHISPNAVEELLHPNVVTISTAFDWNMDVNQKICYSRANQAERIQVTEKERRFASQANSPISIEAFDAAVRYIIFSRNVG
jgi:hypothetical protein